MPSMDQAFNPEIDVAIGDCFAPALIGAETDVCDDPKGWIPMDLAILGEGETAAYHWITCSDALDLIFESDESNNCSVDPAPVLVPESDRSVLAATALMTLLGVVSTRRRASS